MDFPNMKKKQKEIKKSSNFKDSHKKKRKDAILLHFNF